MKKLLALSIWSLLAPFLLQSQPQEKQDLSPIILILDGSGSMWGTINDEYKILIARQVLDELLSGMDTKRPVGLFAYGHRRKGDCTDIENLIEPAVNNRDQIKKELNSINPLGKTPLANTALEVIQKLKDEDRAATIILISDGIESCGGDLCAVVKTAKEAGVDFVLHIVGFDLEDADKLALECAAEAGGGLYLDAADGEELSGALEQASEITVDPQTPTLSVKLTKDGELHDATVTVFALDGLTHVASKRSYDHDDTNPALLAVPPGKYHVRASPIKTNASDIWMRDVTIEADSLKTVELDFTAGKISILTTGNKELWDCVVSVYKKGSNKSLAGGRTYRSERNNPMIKELDPGVYNVDITAMKLQGESTKYTFEDVDIKARETVEISHNFEYGKLSIGATNNGELWDCVINVHAVGDPMRKSLAGGRTYTSANHNPFTELLTPGQYSVNYRAHHIHGKDWDYTLRDMAVRKGEITEANYDYKTGTLNLGVWQNGERCPHNILITENGKSILNKRGSKDPKRNPLSIVLLPGDYEVTIDAYKTDLAKKKISVSIAAGDVIDRRVEF